MVAINPRDNEPYDHVNEVQEAYDAQIKDIGRLKTALGSPSLDPRARKALEDKLAEASKNADKAKKALDAKTDKSHDKKTADPKGAGSTKSGEGSKNK